MRLIEDEGEVLVFLILGELLAKVLGFLLSQSRAKDWWDVRL